MKSRKYFLIIACLLLFFLLSFWGLATCFNSYEDPDIYGKWGIKIKANDEIKFYNSEMTTIGDDNFSCAIIFINEKNIEDFLISYGKGKFFTTMSTEENFLYFEMVQPKNNYCFRDVDVELTTFSHHENIMRINTKKDAAFFDIKKKILWLSF